MDREPTLITSLHKIEDDAELVEQMAYGQAYDRRQQDLYNRVLRIGSQPLREQAFRLLHRDTHINFNTRGYRYESGRSSSDDG